MEKTSPSIICAYPCFVFCVGVFMGREICLGGNKLSGEDAKEIIMADTERIHPQYDGDTNDNDVLLIKLNQPSSAAPLECNTESAVPADQDTVRTIGFGVLSEYGPESENLMEVDVNVVSSAVCKAASEWEVFDDTMVRRPKNSLQHNPKCFQILSFGQAPNNSYALDFYNILLLSRYALPVQEKTVAMEILEARYCRWMAN